ncbi:MAG: TetR/AcrR family transcriptional regulator [Actinobacteria bacterium]|nr:TetR/AcrR family transcriptional regulator [Actinomycetota bacterium]
MEPNGDITVVPRILPRGRNAASREVVRSSQRIRLLEAMTELSAARGFPAVTIADVVTHAGVAKPTFYEHFKDKEACFIAVYDDAVETVLESLVVAIEPHSTVEGRIDAGIAAFLSLLATNDDLARILLIESLKAGPTVAARISEAHRRLAGAYVASREKIRELDPTLPPISLTRGLAIVGAVNEPVTVLLREQPAKEVAGLTDELVSVVRALAFAD